MTCHYWKNISDTECFYIPIEIWFYSGFSHSRTYISFASYVPVKFYYGYSFLEFVTTHRQVKLYTVQSTDPYSTTYIDTCSSQTLVRFLNSCYHICKLNIFLTSVSIYDCLRNIYVYVEKIYEGELSPKTQRMMAVFMVRNNSLSVLVRTILWRILVQINVEKTTSSNEKIVF